MKKLLISGVVVLMTLASLASLANAGCVDPTDLDYTEYDHYGGSPGQCSCDGNCWDSNGFWYADPDYYGEITFGYPGSVDGWGNRWNNYGYWEEDVFYPYENTPEYPEYDGEIVTDNEDWCADGMCDAEVLFWDVDSNNKYYSQVIYVGNLGVFDGYDDGSYKPFNDINRAEFLKALVEFTGVVPDSSYSNCFTDVKTDWYAPYICYAKEQGWVNGYPNGSFKPADTVNKAEALKMLLEVRDAPYTSCMYGAAMDVTAEEWHCPYFQFSNEYDLTDMYEGGSSGFGYYYPADFMTRGEIADLFYRYDMNYLGVQ
ncbi:MAG: S-layer homology domain-containing protein [Candidatus Peregrinibacteria bacterium]